MKLVLLLILWALAWLWGMWCTLGVIRERYPVAYYALMLDIKRYKKKKGQEEGNA